MKQPNIILITADQQRFDTCGPRAPSWMRTPHFDDLCRKGVRFDRAYSDCPVCVPARTTIMTGKHAFNHGMMSNRSSSEVLGREGTLPTRMRELGYQTFGVGKMHFEPERARHGFDETLISSDYHKWLNESGHGVRPMRHGLGQCEMYPSMATVPESLTYTSWTAEQCVDFILDRRDPTVPFFTWCSFSKPHPPFDPPEPYYSMYRDCDIPDLIYGDWSADGECPPIFERTRKIQNYDSVPPETERDARAAYYGLITQIDYNMGRIIAALYDTGEIANTLIIYTADHGEYLFDFHHGGKGFFHEVSAHVPLAIQWPQSWGSEWQRGVPSNQLVCLADILPTCVGAGGGTADDVDGINLLSVLRSEREGREYLEGTMHNFPGEANWYWAITDGHWKYIWYPEGAREQLFDLETDPQELHNLAATTEYSDRKQSLQLEMIRRHQARDSAAVENGKLCSRPVTEEPEQLTRSRMWHGLHTEYLDHDVQH